eukprot:jgi/Bigna1/80607/fgenesh1_pg.72_\
MSWSSISGVGSKDPSIIQEYTRSTVNYSKEHGLSKPNEVVRKKSETDEARMAMLLEQNRALHTRFLLNGSGVHEEEEEEEEESRRRKHTVLYNRKFSDLQLPSTFDGVISSHNGAGLGEGLTVVPSDGELVVGYCDDPMQYFAARIAPHIIPWKPVKLVFVPHLGKQMTTRAVADSRFKDKKLDAKYFPHITICQGWHYQKFLKENRKKTRSHSPPRGYPVDQWVDGVFWPRNSQFKTHRKSERPFIVAANMEAAGGHNCDSYDVLLDTKTAKIHGGCPTIWTSMGIVGLSDHILRGPLDLVKSVGFDAERVLRSKKGFCAFLYRNCFKKFYSNFAAVMTNRTQQSSPSNKYVEDMDNKAGIRVAFFDMISSSYKKPDALGGCRRTNVRRIARNTAGGKESYMDEAVQIFGRYKFVIAMENHHVAGYITEKLINAVLANSVPIYFGAPDIYDYVNPKRFIRCDLDEGRLKEFGNKRFTNENQRETWARENLKGLKDCVEKVRAVDEDDELYKAMISEPFLYGNRLEDSPFDYAYYGKRIRNTLKLYDSDLLHDDL